MILLQSHISSTSSNHLNRLSQVWPVLVFPQSVLNKGAGIYLVTLLVTSLLISQFQDQCHCSTLLLWRLIPHTLINPAISRSVEKPSYLIQPSLSLFLFQFLLPSIDPIHHRAFTKVNIRAIPQVLYPLLLKTLNASPCPK